MASHQAQPCAPLTLSGSYALVTYPGMNDRGPNGEAPMPMTQDYVFAASGYTMEGYPEIRIVGDITVLETEETRLHVRFSNTVVDGTPDPGRDRDVWLTFSDCGTTFEMDGMVFQQNP